MRKMSPAEEKSMAARQNQRSGVGQKRARMRETTDKLIVRTKAPGKAPMRKYLSMKISTGFSLIIEYFGQTVDRIQKNTEGISFGVLVRQSIL